MNRNRKNEQLVCRPTLTVDITTYTWRESYAAITVTFASYWHITSQSLKATTFFRDNNVATQLSSRLVRDLYTTQYTYQNNCFISSTNNILTSQTTYN